MVELLQNTSSLKKLEDKETQFSLIYLFLFLKCWRENYYFQNFSSIQNYKPFPSHYRSNGHYRRTKQNIKRIYLE